MDETEIIDSLKKIKNLRDENKKKVEKIRNVDLEKKKKIINCIVNTEIIQKLIREGNVYDPYGNSGELVWIYPDGNKLNLIDAVNFLRKSLDEFDDR